MLSLLWGSQAAHWQGWLPQGRRKGGVLVHCYAGQSRSVAFVLAYLCACQGLSLPDAYRIVVAARPCARPNAGEAPGRTSCSPACMVQGNWQTPWRQAVLSPAVQDFAWEWVTR